MDFRYFRGSPILGTTIFGCRIEKKANRTTANYHKMIKGRIVTIIGGHLKGGIPMNWKICVFLAKDRL